jgi:hypothetical protein
MSGFRMDSEFGDKWTSVDVLVDAELQVVVPGKTTIASMLFRG